MTTRKKGDLNSPNENGVLETEPVGGRMRSGGVRGRGIGLESRVHSRRDYEGE